MDLDRLRIVNATVHKGVVDKKIYPKSNGKSNSKEQCINTCRIGGTGDLEMSAVKNVIKDNYNMMLFKDYLRETNQRCRFFPCRNIKNTNRN